MRIVLLLLLACLPTTGAAQAAWAPSRPVELIVGVSPGGGVDRTARTIQKIMQDKRLLEVPLNVVNKPGGGGTIAQAYMNQRAGDAHYFEITATSILTNHITGRTTSGHRDYTPVVMLYDEYLGFAVLADSPIKDGRQLLDALKARGKSADRHRNQRGQHQSHRRRHARESRGHRSTAGLKVVVFGSGGESMTALLGGHVGLVVTPSANLIPHMQSGRLRVLGSAPKRIPGALASVPTWERTEA